jgi:signal transduction histidine kinase
MQQNRRRAMLYWGALGSLVVTCCVLAILQYRWIGEISRAEQDRLRAALELALNGLRRQFNSEIARSFAALQVRNPDIEGLGRDAAYALRYRRWRESNRHSELFSRIGLAIPEAGGVSLRLLNPETGAFADTPWPESWLALRDRMISRLHHAGPPPNAAEDTPVVELPRFGPNRMEEQEWLVLELNLAYISRTVLPELLDRHLGPAARNDYDVEVFVRAKPSEVIYRSNEASAERLGREGDASVTLFDTRPGPPERPGSVAATGAGDSGRGRWQLVIRSRAGSLDAIVSRARRQNLAISSIILLLLIAAVAALLRLSRQAQRLAELQMNFVAGVSHELRTPLSVIRTAAFNLKGKLASNPVQVQRYGTLIQDESEKLTDLVEQILRFASAQAGCVIRERTPVAVENVIDAAIQSSGISLRQQEYIVEKHLASDLPLVLADETALKHAIQNLVDNAVKYGLEASDWIGVSASKVNEDGLAVEIRVADRGPGIPSEEQEHIFDPFFRGKRAVQDQVHGTGLGLNLVKKIVEAHGGTIRVHSESSKGTEFVMRIPAAPLEQQNEFAHSID